MVEDEQIAKQISDLMVEFGGRLDRSIALVQENCSEQEFETYRTAVSKILVAMLFEVMNPLYQRHFGLKPAGLK
jgi:hypothetical protein